MLQGLLNLKIPSPPAHCPAPREFRAFIAPEDLPRFETTLVLRGRDSADGPQRLLLVERHASQGEWIAVKREDGIRVERYCDATSGGERLGAVIATLPPGKRLRYVHNLRAFPARRAG